MKDAVESISELFERAVSENPEGIALFDGEKHVNYADLGKRANQLTAYLRKAGAKQQTRVGLHLDCTIDLVLATLATLKAGCTCVRLDPASTRTQLAFMVEDSHISIVITKSAYAKNFPRCCATLICLDIGWPDDSDENSIQIIPDNGLAFINYQFEKDRVAFNIAISQKSILKLVKAFAHLRCSSQQAFIQYYPLSMDAVNLDLWLAFSARACCVLLPSGMSSLNDLSVLIEKHNVRNLRLPARLVPQAVSSFPKTLARLERLFLTNSTDVTANRLMPAVELVSHGRILSLYDPLDCGLYTCCYEFKNEPRRRYIYAPIGKPIAESVAYLTDIRLQPVPIGVAGELYISAEELARGYLGRPDLIAEKFIPNPFSKEPGRRMYKTGDLARYLPDGNLEYLGRLDHQVKIRGYRIELGEIEAVLAEHESVREAVVLAKQTESGDKRLVGYIVAGEELRASELKAYLKERLPDYMVPTHYMFLEKLPLTANGKVDRKALPDMEADRPDLNDEYAEPRTATEEILAGIWVEVLKIREVGIHDNFFELGGHSLLATQLISRVSDIFRVKIPLRSVFETPTVATMATRIDANVLLNASLDPWTPVVCIQRNGSNRPLFCVYPIAGDVFSYNDLAVSLGKNQPIFGLQVPKVVGPSQGRSFSVEEVATISIAAMQSIQNEGPYLLAGWSFGGLIAFEMAQQLMRQNVNVALLALFDTRPFAERRNELIDADDATVLLETIRILAQLHGKPLGIAEGSLVGLEADDKLLHIAKYSIESGLISPEQLARMDLSKDLDAIQIRRYIDGERFRWRAATNYVPQPYSGRIIFFRASGSGETVHFNSLEQGGYGWEKIALEPIRIFSVPGNHDNMLLLPHVSFLANLLARELNSFSMD